MKKTSKTNEIQHYCGDCGHGILFYDFQNLDFEFYQALLNSPLLEELKAVYPKTLFLFAESRVKTFSPELIPLFQKENQLNSEYSKLVASAQIPFEGEVRTLSQLAPFTQSTEATMRKRATEKITGFYAENEEKFDDVLSV